MNLKYMKVSLFEISYNKNVKLTFSPYSNFLRCTCMYVYMYICMYIYIRASTNDYFDNQLVGRLFFRLIGLNKMVFY